MNFDGLFSINFRLVSRCSFLNKSNNFIRIIVYHKISRNWFFFALLFFLAIISALTDSIDSLGSELTANKVANGFLAPLG